MKTAIVIGTRPEIIKIAPVVRELENNRVNYFILHSGQHFSCIYHLQGSSLNPVIHGLGVAWDVVNHA